MRRSCTHCLEHIQPYVERGLCFQAFARLWSAFQMFLQALFIAHRTYPIACDKWIHEQIVEMLGLSELYAQLPPLFKLGRCESPETRGLQLLLVSYVEA